MAATVKAYSGPESVLELDPVMWIKLLHETFPHFGDKEFTFPMQADAQMSYGLMTLGVLGGTSVGILLLMLLGMWLFHCCMCCQCCRNKCYCARCCCCSTKTRGKCCYFLIMLLGVGALAPGWLGRTAAQQALKDMGAGIEGLQAVINGANGHLNDYAGHMTAMSALIDGAATCNGKSQMKDTLAEINKALGEAQLPIDDKTLEPMVKMLKPYAIPPDFGKLLAFEDAFLTFSLDAMFAVIAILTAMLAFFACFANCNLNMSKSGFCACLHGIYKTLVLVFSSLILILNMAIGGISLVVAVMFADMCSKGPAETLKEMLAELGIKFPGEADFFWWTSCAGTHPLKVILDGIKTPLDKLVKDLWEPTKNGVTPHTAGDCNAVKMADYLDPDAIKDGMYTSKSQLTVWEFNELFHCKGINTAFHQVMHKGVCNGLTETFFWLWVALFGSTFFLVIGFWLLACVSRDNGSDDDDDDDDDDEPVAKKGKGGK